MLSYLVLAIIGLLSTYFFFKRSGRRTKSEIDRLLFDNLETFDRSHHPDHDHNNHENSHNDGKEEEEDSLAPKKFNNSSDYLKKRYPNLDRPVGIKKQKEDLYRQYKSSSDLVKKLQNSVDADLVIQTLSEARSERGSERGSEQSEAEERWEQRYPANNTHPTRETYLANNGLPTGDTYQDEVADDRYLAKSKDMFASEDTLQGDNDFITNSTDLVDALNKINSLNIKDENKQFLVESMEDINPMSPQIRGRREEVDAKPHEHSALKALLRRRQEFNNAPMRLFDKSPSRDSTSVKSTPDYSRTPPVDVVKGATVDAYANYRRGSMSPQERIMENIKNLGKGERSEEVTGNVRPSKARNPEYLPHEEEPIVPKIRGVIKTPKIQEKCQSSVTASPSYSAQYAAPAPFSYMNAAEPRANFAELKARRRETVRENRFDDGGHEEEEFKLTSGKKRGSVKNLAKMFERSPSPKRTTAINKRSRHKSDGMALSQAKPLTKSKSLVFEDSTWSLDQSEVYEPKSCSYSSSKYDDEIEQPVRDKYSTELISDFESGGAKTKRDRFNVNKSKSAEDDCLYSRREDNKRLEQLKRDQEEKRQSREEERKKAQEEDLVRQTSREQSKRSSREDSQKISSEVSQRSSREEKERRSYREDSQRSSREENGYSRDNSRDNSTPQRRISSIDHSPRNQYQTESGYQTGENVEDRSQKARQEEKTSRFSNKPVDESYIPSIEEDSAHNNRYNRPGYEFRVHEPQERGRAAAHQDPDSDVESTSSLSRAVSPVRSSNRKNFKKSRNKPTPKAAQVSDDFSSMMSRPPASYGDSNEDLIGSGSSTTSLKENDQIIDSNHSTLDRKGMVYGENKTHEQNAKKKIPMSIKEYQHHFNQKQESVRERQESIRDHQESVRERSLEKFNDLKQEQSKTSDRKPTWSSQQARGEPRPHHAQFTSPHVTGEPRGLIKCSPVSRNSNG